MTAIAIPSRLHASAQPIAISSHDILEPFDGSELSASDSQRTDVQRLVRRFALFYAMSAQERQNSR